MRSRVDAGMPPRELEDFYLWCIGRGEFDTAASVYTGDHEVWVEARRQWARVHGWPGGESVMLAGEVVAGEEPFDPDLI
jgi:hypothetical protein